MKNRNKVITVNLLKMAKRLEIETNRLKECGVTVLPLENTQYDIINVALLVNGISKNDDSVAWLCEPIFSYTAGETKCEDCLRELQDRIAKVKQERFEERKGE